MFEKLTPGWSLGGFLPLTVKRELSAEISFDTKFKSEDEKWMFVALMEGMKGCGITNPNPSVGCVFVKDGKQIAAGSTEIYKHRHAERVAFDQLPTGLDLSGCTAYITLEPCTHQGHQPPCVDLFKQRKVGRIVVATTDSNPKVNGEGMAELKRLGVQVTQGVLEKEARLWHLPFLAYHTLGRPIIVGKWAETQNGILADDSGKPLQITGEYSRAYTHWLRQKYDLIVVGANTVLNDSPLLSVRDARSPILRKPLRVIVDPRNRIQDISPELSEKTFSEDPQTVLLLSQDGKFPRGLPSHVKVVRLPGKEIVPGFQKWITSEEAKSLFGKPIQSVFIEGGPALLGSFLEAGALDTLHVFTSEKKVAGSKYKVPFEKMSANYQLVHQTDLLGDTLKEYVSNALKDVTF